MATFIDALGRIVAIDGIPRRIVSLVPSITEALFFWGAGPRIAGVTHFCREPRDGVAEKVKVGGTKTVEVDRLLALRPDLVIASAEENDQEQVEAIIAAGIPVYITLPKTVEEAIEMLSVLGQMTGGGEKAQELVRQCRAALKEVRGKVEKRGRVTVFAPIWRGPWMTIGPGTYMYDLLFECGGEGIFPPEKGRYFHVSLEEVAALDPYVVLLPSEPFRFRPRHIGELAQAGIAAAQKGRAYLVDGRYLCWYGPRIPMALHYVSDLLLSA